MATTRYIKCSFRDLVKKMGYTWGFAKMLGEGWEYGGDHFSPELSDHFVYVQKRIIAGREVSQIKSVKVWFSSKFLKHHGHKGLIRKMRKAWRGLRHAPIMAFEADPDGGFKQLN